MAKIVVRQLEWNNDGYVFYALGHLPPSDFLQSAMPIMRAEIGETLDDCAPTAEDVRHVWYRHASPYECKTHGWDSGYFETEAPIKTGRGQPFKVTSVEL